MSSPKVILGVILFITGCLCEEPDLSGCEVAAKTEQGYVCGKTEEATDGRKYASFKGIPYAKQPLGDLRFKELQPAEPFDGIFNATEEGPYCAQVDILYLPYGLAAPTPTGEDCIRINIYLPEQYLPDVKAPNNTKELLPILFWVHGGSFSYGSGNSDVHGPQYLMTKDCMLITINYRLHVLGFLSLDNEYIPGNNGLRDCITALKWVQRNIKNFGGDPDRVTIGGQSAGGALVHLLSISPATKGLFKQVVALSGLSIGGFYSYYPKYVKITNTLFFSAIGIDPLQTPKKVHDDLVAAPIEKILEANKVILDTYGLVSFAPVIEKPQPNFTTVIPKDPEELLNEGAGKEYPLIIGFCSNEGQVLKKRLIEVNIETKLKLVPSLTLPQTLLFSANALTLPVLTTMHLTEYFNVTFITLDKFLSSVTDCYYKYPAQRVIQKRLSAGAAKTYLYEFGYQGEKSPVKLSIKETFPGACHEEDLTYFFRFNHLVGPQTEPNELAHTSEDNRMKDWMTTYIANFIIKGSPADVEAHWPASQGDLKFQNIERPLVSNFTTMTPYMRDKHKYYTRLYFTNGFEN